MKIPHGMIAVITGAGSGLGRAFAEVLASTEARLVLCDVNQAGLDETLGSVRALGAREALGLRCDVTRLDDWQRLRKAAEAVGDVDLLVNNAGVGVGGQLLDVPEADLRWVMDVNLWGVLHGCRTFGPGMRERRRGYIINIASAAGLLNPPGLGPYNITKSGVVSLSETLHAELRGVGVRVTAVCPTFFKTAILDNGRGTNEGQRAFVEKLMKRSRVQAPDVARHALKSVLAGDPHSVPMLDAKGFWALKRMFPRGYALLASRMAKLSR
ncbi:MAG: SDR family NAD(P)-dependent oxidoreductase [Polyangiaceae bacterium]